MPNLKQGAHGVFARLAESQAFNTPTIQFLQFNPVTAASAVALIAASEPVDGSTMRDLILEAFDARVNVDLATIRVHQQNPLTYRAVLRRQVEAKAATADELKRLIHTAGDQYIDQTEGVWKLVTVGGSKQLVRQDNDDFQGLLKARQRRFGMAVASLEQNPVPVLNGDYAMYVRDDGRVGFGLAYYTQAGLQVFDREYQSSQTVAADRLIDAQAGNADNLHDLGDAAIPEGFLTQANLSGKTVDEVLGYYKRIYGDKPQFFGALEKLMKGMADRVDPVSVNPDVNDQVKNQM